MNPPEFKIDAPPQPRGIFARIRLLDQSLTFFLAVLILIIFVVFPLAGLGWLGKFVVDLVISILLLSGAVTSTRSRTLTVLVVLLTIAGLVVHWTGAYVPKFSHPVLEPVLLFCCLLAFAVISADHVQRQRQHRLSSFFFFRLSHRVHEGAGFVHSRVRNRGISVAGQRRGCRAWDFRRLRGRNRRRWLTCRYLGSCG